MKMLLAIHQGVDGWNTWRRKERRPDLTGVDLSGAPLSGADLSGADLSHADLSGADLSGGNLTGTGFVGSDLRGAILDHADLREANFNEADLGGASLLAADLRRANLIQADLSEAKLVGAKFFEANLFRAKFTGSMLLGAELFEADLFEADLLDADLSKAKLRRADLRMAQAGGAKLRGADLRGAKLRGARLRGADLSDANLSGADAKYADLQRAILVGTNLTNTDLTGSLIYGMSAWDLNLEGATQRELVITPIVDGALPGFTITVDNIEVAQFIYLLLNNEKIRHVINTITSKVVLILGRFTTKRKAVLDALRDELRRRDYLPVLIDFDKPASRDITETLSLLARMARFVVADITDARSIPQELGVIVRDLPSVAVQPLLLEGADEYGMFEHFKRYPWVLKTYVYASPEELVANLNERVIEPAEAKALELQQRRGA
jgi:uncharacterized protein YjbI with pentapeptide repeats